MKKPGYQKRMRGFSILELMVVLVIAAILITLAIMNIVEQKRAREFKTNCDKLCAFVKQAQSQGRAYGTGPKMLDASGNNNLGFNFTRVGEGSNPADNHRYVVTLLSTGLGKEKEQLELKNICLSTNMGFQALAGNDLNSFRGTLLFIAYDDDAGVSQSQTMIYFGPTGLPGYPEEGNLDASAQPDLRLNHYGIGSALMESRVNDMSYWIGLTYKGGNSPSPKYMRRIAINKNQGAVSLQRPRGGVASPSFSNENDWEPDI